MQPTDLCNQQRNVLTGIRNKVVIVRGRAGQVDVIATPHDEAAFAGMVSPFDIQSPRTGRRTVAPR